MIDFARTPMGMRFFDSTLPDFVLQLRRVATTLEDVAETLRAVAERKSGTAPPKETTHP